MSENEREGMCQGRQYISQNRDEGWCQRNATHGEFCIFHAPIHSKNHDEFKTALLRAVERMIDHRLNEWNFSGFIFTGYIHADELTPLRNLNGDPHFPASTSFVKAQFTEGVWLDRAQFDNSTHFGSARFDKFASFERTKFNGNVSFNSAKFIAGAWFDDAKFGGNTRFFSTHFVKEAWFNTVLFRGSTNFYRAHFGDEANFYRTKFQGGLHLSNTEFWSGSNFREVTLRRELNLSHCSFSQAGDFENAIIVGHVRVKWPGKGDKWSIEANDQRPVQIPRGTLHFNNLQGKTLINWRESQRVRESAILDLRDNYLADDTNLIIENCTMEHILLCGTDATQIQFKENEWRKLDDKLFGRFEFERQVVGDEFLQNDVPRHPEQSIARRMTRIQFYRRIRTTYQQLSKRFREDLNHPLAVEFDRGAFEMRLCEARLEEGLTSRGTQFWLSVYKHTSHYSGSLLLPSLLWIGLIVVSYLVYTVLDPNIFWFSCPVGSYIDGSKHFEYFLLSVRSALSLTTSTTDVTEDGISVTGLLLTLQSVERTLSFILGALFVFSLQRRVKH